MVYGTAGAVPLAAAGAAAKQLAGAPLWIKANFDPDQPRVPADNPDGGQWTSEGDSADPANTVPVQELLTLPVRPPLLLDESPETVRPFKETIPRLSGKEGAKGAPSWARGNRPYVGENGRDFAKRLMDEKYGPGNWGSRYFEYRRIQKWGDRAFRDPRSILLPGDDRI